MALGFKTDEIQRMIAVDDEGSLLIKKLSPSSTK
jgi:hypothetical protein